MSLCNSAYDRQRFFLYRPIPIIGRCEIADYRPIQIIGRYGIYRPIQPLGVGRYRKNLYRSYAGIQPLSFPISLITLPNMISAFRASAASPFYSVVQTPEELGLGFGLVVCGVMHHLMKFFKKIHKSFPPTPPPPQSNFLGMQSLKTFPFNSSSDLRSIDLQALFTAYSRF